MPSIPPPEDTTAPLLEEAPCQPKKAPRPRKATEKNDTLVAARKRSKTSDNAEDDEEEKKRSRGRPRLDTKDESAADVSIIQRHLDLGTTSMILSLTEYQRRRTQIRLAQRAYRNRKDTAITTLEQKVKDLEQVNEDMGKEFMRFYDFVLSQGMLDGAPEVARRLNDTTRKFLTFGRKSNEDGSKENSDPSPPPPEVPQVPEASTQRQDSKISSGASSYSHDRHSTSSNPQLQSPSSMDANSAPAHSSSLSSFMPPSTMPYEVITQPTPENASFPVFNSQGQVPFFDNSFNISPFPAIPAPNSYAFQERSFGRRLQRATLEAGFRLVSMANPPPHRYAAVFGFCLLFEPREAIIRRISTSLSKSREETMSVWKFPFTNLGGAGTFFPDSQPTSNLGGSAPDYPTRNQVARELYKPRECTGFSMGPFSPEVEQAKDDRVDHRMRMMFQGFEGDFYDSEEVDTYLQQRGIIIPENADYVQADIDISTFQEAPELGNMGNPSQGLQGMPMMPSASDFSGPYSTGSGSVENYWSATLPTTGESTSMSTVSHMTTPMGHQMGHPMGSLVPDIPVSAPMQFSASNLSYPGSSDFSQNAWPASACAWTKTRVTIDVARLVVGKSLILSWRDRMLTV